MIRDWLLRYYFHEWCTFFHLKYYTLYDNFFILFSNVYQIICVIWFRVFKFSFNPIPASWLRNLSGGAYESIWGGNAPQCPPVAPALVVPPPCRTFLNILRTTQHFQTKFCTSVPNLLTHLLAKFWVHTTTCCWRKHFLCHVIDTKNGISWHCKT